MAQAAVLVCLALTVTACGKSDPKSLLVGQWLENLQSEKWVENKRRSPDTPAPKERTVHFFADGTGVDKAVYDDPEFSRTESFKWSLSEDGKILKTETPSKLSFGYETGGTRVAHVVTLTPKALRIDETSHANGLFERVNN